MSLFGCAVCSGPPPLYHEICGACLQLSLEAWNGPATDEEFDAFWAVWFKGRKVGKEAARVEYRKARKRASAETILAAAVAYVASVQDREPKHVMHARTWLHQGWYLDEQESYDCGTMSEADRMRRNVQWFIDKRMWLDKWGPRPDEPDAEPLVKRIYEEVRA